MLLGFFVFVYYDTFIKSSMPSVAGVLAAFQRLGADDQAAVWQAIQKLMQNATGAVQA
jgi:hypothetical protein